MDRLTSLVPVLGWLPAYDRSWLRPDLIAGLTLWGLVVPQGMAYAGIAGLPPQAGLYTLVASLLVYALFGTSRHLSVGATSASAALIGSTVVALGATTSDPTAYAAYAAALVLVLGGVFLLAGVARLGFVTQFLSKPVMDGFITGLAAFVIVGQLNKLFGVEKGEGNTVEELLAVVTQQPETNGATFVVGAAALALLFGLPRLNRAVPAGLVALFGFIALSSALGLNATYGVDVVGTLPPGLPSVSLPDVSLATAATMILPAIGILLVVYSEAVAAAGEFARKHGYEIDPDQELTAHGAVNAVSGLLGGLIAGGGMSATAVKEAAGARSQLSNLVAWALAIVTVLFLTPLFASLPEAVLAALIINALWHILTARRLRQIRHASPTEFWFAAIAFLGVILIDVLPGMLIGLFGSLIYMIYRSTRPHLASLGRVPGVGGVYRDLERHPDAEPIPGLLIVRLDAPLYYANALSARAAVKSLLAAAPEPPRAVLIDAATQDSLDLTSGEMLVNLIRELRAAGIDVLVAEVHAPVMEAAERSGLAELIGRENFHLTVDLAVEAFTSRGTDD